MCWETSRLTNVPVRLVTVSSHMMGKVHCCLFRLFAATGRNVDQLGRGSCYMLQLKNVISVSLQKTLQLVINNKLLQRIFVSNKSLIVISAIRLQIPRDNLITLYNIIHPYIMEMWLCLPRQQRLICFVKLTIIRLLVYTMMKISQP